MKLIWKVVWTVVIVLVGPAAVHGLSGFVDATLAFNTEEIFPWLIDFIIALVLVLPAWFMWKGTHLVPIIFNLTVRIVIMVAILAILPALTEIFSNANWASVTIGPLGTWNVFEFATIAGIYFFSLWGIWVKS